MEIQQAFGHPGRVFGLAFHPIWGQNVLASASEDETVRVWCRSRPTDDWEQTSCCRGHSAEVLRVTWSPDGRLLASGSADQTVRLWQVGTQGQFSYSGQELAVLRNHPGEVYGLKFLNLPTCTTQLIPTQDGQQQQQQVALYDTLLTASGDSLFLWDLTAGRIIHQSAPLPVMSMLRKLQLSSNPAAAVGAAAAAGSGTVRNQVTGAGFAAGALGGQQQQQQGQSSSNSTDTSTAATAAAAANGDDNVEDDIMPSYIFGVAAADATNWLCAVCSDGMLRLWDASKRSLQEIAAIKAHPSGIGSCCSFIPQQPWLLLSIAKSGQAVLQDIRMLGRPLLQQQLEGPVFDMAWTVRQVQQQQQQQISPAAAAAGVDTSSSSSSNSTSNTSNSYGELVLQVVGRDEFVRSYPFTRTALQTGSLPDPDLLRVSCLSYSGTLLSVAATLDGKTLAAAGEAVLVETLKPRKYKKQQQQQQHVGSNGTENGSSSSSTQKEQPAAAAAAGGGGGGGGGDVIAAAKRVSAAGRRNRNKRSTAAVVDLFDMADQGLEETNPQQQPQQQQQSPEAAEAQQPQPTATNTDLTTEQLEVERQLDALAASGIASTAAAAGQGPSGSSSSSSTNNLSRDYSSIVESFAAQVGVKVSDMPPEWAQMVAAAAAAGMMNSSGPNAAAAAACPAAVEGLTQAPLFTTSV